MIDGGREGGWSWGLGFDVGSWTNRIQSPRFARVR